MKKMSRNEILNSLEPVQYSDALKHYEHLKDQFLLQYSFVAQKTQEEVEKEIEEEVFSTINKESIEKQNEISEDMFNQIANAVKEALQSQTNKKSLKNLKALNNQQSQKKTAKVKQTITEGLEKILSEQDLRDIIITSLNNKGYNKNGFEIKDLLNQAKSYRNKLILIRRNSSARKQISISKGYFREALVHKAFSSLADNLDKKINIHSGSRKDNKGKDTAYDEFIDFLNNIDDSFETTVNASSLGIGTGFSIQTKSWSAPWESNSPLYWGYNIGSRNKLLKQMTGEYKTYSWIDGVKFLENHLVEALGERQLGYVTGKQIYWTFQLIKNFRDMNYFYAFVFNKNHEATRMTSWQTIKEDS